jgi:hypothetical protein
MKAVLLMLKMQLLAMILIFQSVVSLAQTTRKADVILMRNDTKLEVLIQEVEEQVIKYRKLNDPEGPLFSVRKSEIASIHYGNGEVETFEAVLDVPSYYAPAKSAEPRPQPQVKSGNKVLAEIQNSDSDHLRATYKFYKSRSKAGMALGIAGTSVGALIAAIGTGLVVSSEVDAYGNYMTYQDQRRARSGAIMMLGGFAGGVTLGTIGFVRGGKNGARASRIRKELIRRNESVTIRVAPAFYAANRYGSLTFNMIF